MLSITNSGKHAHEARKCDPHSVVLLNMVIHDHNSLFYFSIHTDLYVLFHVPVIYDLYVPFNNGRLGVQN